ncbi:hypothetical protein PT974_04558 [Cladobotryum mycophilum]|uniref:Heterokaryon incompatibility domain-containing protein n=1 Tax=Cladobotryum mycophilum TaxID=491253 RepID=A0ABR0SVA5_9HYPO
MDHLSLPIDDFAQSPFEIPFLCNDRFCYDGNGFLTYPARIGLDLDQIIEQGLVDPDTLAPALQAWLWFGLLGEILSIGTRTHVSQRVATYKAFISEKPNGASVICTSHLRQYINQVGQTNKSLRQDGFYSERYHASLEMATAAVKRLSSSNMCLKQLEATTRSSQPPVLLRIILSIQVLVETLYAAKAVLVPGNGDSLFRSELECSGLEIVRRLLLNSGWCKYEIQRLPSSIRLRYYLSFLRPSDFTEGHSDHSSCTESACSQIELDKQRIYPKHATNGCWCAMVTLEDHPISQIVQAGSVPIVTFAQTDGTTRKLKILETRLDQKTKTVNFVAISHVRRAGLGNADAHSLPYCRLALIQELANQLHNSLSSVQQPHGMSSTPFWLDTLCVPSDSRVHGASLGNIRQVFKDASHVLVLDQTLSSHAIGSSEDALIRIRYSLWKQRLWTLQEGFVTSPSRLMFRFANTTVSLLSLIDSFEATVPFPLISCHQFIGFQVLPFLHHVLELLNDDVRAMTKMPRGLTRGLDKIKLRGILRLGYLTYEHYQYFREDWETEQIARILPLLGDLYLDSAGLPVREGWRSEKQVAADLKRLNDVEI